MLNYRIIILNWKAINQSADLQEKIRGGTDLIELGKENGRDFGKGRPRGYDELKDSGEELNEFEMEVVSDGRLVDSLIGKFAQSQGQFCSMRCFISLKTASLNFSLQRSILPLLISSILICLWTFPLFLRGQNDYK